MIEWTIFLYATFDFSKIGKLRYKELNLLLPTISSWATGRVIRAQEPLFGNCLYHRGVHCNDRTMYRCLYGGCFIKQVYWCESDLGCC